jgi:hypothetical protein
MEREIELAAAGPTSETALAPQRSKDAVETASALERGLEVVNDGHRRGWQLFAIVLALFVGAPFLGLQSFVRVPRLRTQH